MAVVLCKGDIPIMGGVVPKYSDFGLGEGRRGLLIHRPKKSMRSSGMKCGVRVNKEVIEREGNYFREKDIEKIVDGDWWVLFKRVKRSLHST